MYVFTIASQNNNTSDILRCGCGHIYKDSAHFILC